MEIGWPEACLTQNEGDCRPFFLRRLCRCSASADYGAVIMFDFVTYNHERCCWNFTIET